MIDVCLVVSILSRLIRFSPDHILSSLFHFVQVLSPSVKLLLANQIHCVQKKVVLYLKIDW